MIVAQAILQANRFRACLWTEGETEETRDFPTYNDFLKTVIFTPENNRDILHVHNGLKEDYRLIDYRKLLEDGYSVVPIMGIGDIRALKVSRPKPGKERKKKLKPQDKHIWYLQDSLLKTNMRREELIKTFAPFLPSKSILTLHHALTVFGSLLEGNFGTSFKKAPTMAGLAMSSFRGHVKSLAEELQGVTGRIRDCCEESYFGALSYCLNRREHEDCVTIDANSHYASVMRTYPMPSGEPVFRSGTDWQDDDLVLATVDIPAETLPILKSRVGSLIVDESQARSLETKKTGTGRTSGWHWGFELRQQEKLGGVVHEWEYIRWPERSNLLQSFIEKCRSLRNLDPQGPLGWSIKLLQNSLYGRFAMRPMANEAVMSLNDPGGGAWPVLPDGPGGNQAEIDTVLWKRPSPRPYMAQDMIHWGSYIVARARYELVDKMTMIGWERVIYADTDSITVEKRDLSGPIEAVAGTDYGQWKIEKTPEFFQALGIKSYHGSIEGKPYRVQSGLPPELIQDRKGGEKVGIEKKVSIKTLMAQEIERKAIERMVKITDEKSGSGSWTEDDLWIPPHIDQNLEAYLSRRKISHARRDWIALMKEKLPSLFATLPDPIQGESRYGKNYLEKIERWIERVWEKRHEYSISNKKDSFGPGNAWA